LPQVKALFPFIQFEYTSVFKTIVNYHCLIINILAAMHLFLKIRFQLLMSLILGLSAASQSQNTEIMSKHTNALINENSPYLLQHAHNPVNWFPWDKEALDKAKKENKMLIISIGYAACHWCHVMEHESFEDEEVARIMNEHFISIKVDREERPDIDDIYMTACQITNGRNCGWPLNAFALPDGRPVWAGTYFPKVQWMSILEQFNNYQQNDPDRLEEAAANVLEGIRQVDKMITTVESKTNNKDIIDQLHDGFLNQIDWIKGGRAGQPKFPLPNNYQFLLDYHHHYNNTRSLEAVRITLDQMAMGGIYDQLGGGFARYSVDKNWLAPHFEKMLYDNAQLVSLYSNAFKQTGNAFYEIVIRETLAFTERELMSEEGAFYSSLDADSEGVEGKFYVWLHKEIVDVIPDDKERNLFCEFYNVRPEGNWEDGQNILHCSQQINLFAQTRNLDTDYVKNIIYKNKKKLFDQRERRIRPGLDDKVLTAWNALMLEGFIQAYKALGDQKYLTIAIKNGQFIRQTMMDKDHRLSRSYKNKQKKINAFLDDYAATIQAYLSLYEVTFDISWLKLAKDLTDYAIAHFYDEEKHVFYYTSDIDPELITRKSELSDNVIPGSVSMMCNNLILLSHYYSENIYHEIAQNLINSIKGTLEKAGSASYYSNWLTALLKDSEPLKEVVIIGDNKEEFRDHLQKHFLPDAIFIGDSTENELPLTQNRSVEGKTLIYVCQDKVCKIPVDNPEDALKIILE
jgi:uncharacterized protein YyaL (SSP411 family)